MIDDQIILTAERLRDDLTELRSTLKQKYKEDARQVTSDELKATSARLAEKWLVDLAPRDEVATAIDANYFADLNVHFQRLLTFSERATQRTKYDSEIKQILRRFTLEVIMPLKQLRSGNALQRTFEPQKSNINRTQNDFIPSAFVAHSFSVDDQRVVHCILQALKALGLNIVTGEKPKADTISEKVKRLIDGQYLFVGVFTRQDKIARKNEWTASSWIIDEKAYAVAKQKKLILLKETGVASIGGLQGNYEFIEFSRNRLEDLVVHIIEMLDIQARGLRL